MRMRFAAASVAVLTSFLAAGGAAAQGRGVEAGKEAETWSAVGILRVDGGSWCSAALISPSTVLTAAHCVYPDGRREIYDPNRVTFHAGWRDGITAAVRRAVRIVAHRDYDPTKPYDEPNIASDLAIVEIDEPIPSDVAKSFPPLDKIRLAEPVSVVSFSGRRSDVASINDTCSFKTRDKDILIMGCESYSGMSGAPVFSFVNGQARVVALISGQRISYTGQNNGIALAVRGPLDRVLLDAKATASTPLGGLPFWTRKTAAAAAATPVATRRTIKVGSGLSDLTGSGGARKVVRPPKSN